MNAYYNHNDNRAAVIVASLNESTFWNYRLGFLQAGLWLEVYNGDVFDNFPNPIVAGNRSSISAGPTPRDGLPASATITIPANGLLVFARDRGDCILKPDFVCSRCKVFQSPLGHGGRDSHRLRSG